jgi:hypothetical protein
MAPLALILTLASACESGWDVEGRVETAGAPDKTRPLYIYAVNAKSIEPAALQMGAGSIEYWLVSKVSPMPADAVAFAVHAFGCHRGAFAAIAWAPATFDSTGPAPDLPFEPKAGDYVVVSDVRTPYCGWQSRPEHITLVLDGQTYPRP